MKRRLWTVLADRVPMAVVAAADLHAAWVIVRAMEDFDDLPSGVEIKIEACSESDASFVVAKAKRSRKSEQFLAYLSKGQFVLSYGALSAKAPLRHRDRLAA